MTALDFIGVYDPLTRLKSMGFVTDLEWELCAYTPDVSDDKGLHFTPTRVKQPLTGYDVIIVPGGLSTRALMQDQGFVGWLKTAAACRLKVSVCTGSLLLGAAGYLSGKTATTHPNAFNELRKFSAAVVPDRVVQDGDVITARGVTAGIDLGLYLVEKFAGREVKERIRKQMDYPCCSSV